MAGRVSDAFRTTQIIQRIFQQRQLIANVENELSTGLRVIRPSDDAARAGAIQGFQSTLLRLQRHEERIAFATNLLSQQEGVLTEAGDLMLRAKELAQSAANGTLSPDQRQLIAQEVWGLRDSMVSLANTQIQGRYIYGGALDDAAPFQQMDYGGVPADPEPGNVRWTFDDTAAGHDLTRTVRIGDSIDVRINSDGGDVWQRSIGVLERLGRALDGYSTDPSNPLTPPDGTGAAYNFPGDETTQQNDILALIDAIDTASTQDLLAERTDVGGRLARVEQAQALLDSVQVETEKSRSKLQDADVFDAASRFSLLQNGLEASLAVGARVNSLTLLNFI